MRLFYLLTVLGQTTCADVSNTVDLVKLAAASLELAQYGGQALLDAVGSSDLGVKSKESFGHREVVTNADLESNKRVSFAYPVYFPGVHVRSEETTGEPADVLSLPRTDDQWNNHKYYNLLQSTLYNEELRVPAENVTIWVDPLDATREYTEGLYQYVTNMIGIAVNGRPVIGILNAPFQNRTKLGFAYGSKTLNLDIGDVEEAITTGDNVYVSRSFWQRLSSSGRRQFQRTINPHTIIPAGGAGHKAWRVIDEVNSAYIHTRRIKLWDLCAPEAVLRASGGQLTQLDGTLIHYGPLESALHTQGVIATTSPAVHHEMLQYAAEIINIE
jgi:inositol monophosphatase 3